MPQDSYVVFGAGGPTGYETVKALAADPALKQATILAAVRDEKKYLDRFATPLAAEGAGAAVSLIQADVTDKASVEAALRKEGTACKGVVFAASGSGYWSAAGVDRDGVKNVAEAAAALPSKPRVVLVSSMLTHPSNRFHPIRVLLNNIRWSLMDHKYAGEEALRKSGAEFVVLRPGGLATAPAGSRGALKSDKDVEKEVGTGALPRADVAAAAVRALKDGRAAGHTFSIYAPRAKKGDPPAPTVDAAAPAYAQMIAGLFD